MEDISKISERDLFNYVFYPDEISDSKHDFIKCHHHKFKWQLSLLNNYKILLHSNSHNLTKSQDVIKAAKALNSKLLFFN